MAFVDYEGSTAQCLTCKKFFPADPNQVYKYCPACGVELKKEFTKCNPRYSRNLFRQHFPFVEIWCLQNTYTIESGFFSSLKSMFNVDPPKPKQEWKKYGYAYMAFNGFGFRKNLLSKINTASKTVDSPSKIKLIIKTWDGHEKTIYGSCLKSVFNRPYQKIHPTKPYTMACSGVSTELQMQLNYRSVAKYQDNKNVKMVD